MQCIVWMADAGAEVMLLVSINSLRRNARAFWGSAVKLVLDFGLTSPVAAFLGTLVTEHLYCAPVPLPPPHSVAGGDPPWGVGGRGRARAGGGRGSPDAPAVCCIACG